MSAADPTCDHFIARAENPRVKRVLIAIAPDEGVEGDDYDLFVNDNQENSWEQGRRRRPH